MFTITVKTRVCSNGNAPSAEIDVTTVEEAHKRTTWEEN
jgi:hypothetical protein